MFFFYGGPETKRANADSNSWFHGYECIIKICELKNIYYNKL